MNPLFVTTAITLSLLASAAGADSIEEGSGGQLDDGFPEVQTAAVTAADGESYAASKEELSLSFIFHIDEEMAEQDVFYEKELGSGEVWRPTAATRDMSAPLYAPATPVAHNFLDTTDTGPYPKGKPLGITLGEWFAAKGEGRYACEDGQGEIDLRFTGLVPNGVYTLWHDFFVWPPTDPFIGTYDLPFGARDGSENVFTANADGKARIDMSFAPCLQLSGEHLLADLAIAWHSDSKTHGPLPGEFSTNTHVQMYVTLPKRSGV